MDADHTVSVAFRQADAKDISVNIDVDAQIEIRTTGGEIDFGKVVPNGNVKVKPGSSLKITVLLNPGFEIGDFKVDGKSVGKVTEYTIEDIQKSVDISISVVKQVDGYVIKATAGSGGKITPSGETTVEKGKDATFTFSANSGYTVSEVLVDGKKITATGSYTFKNVTSDHTISVSFKYTGGGGVTPSKTLMEIEITKQPTKTAYFSGESFDAAGMVVTATYSDSTTKVVTDYTYSPSGALTTADTTITVAFEGKTDTFGIAVVESNTFTVYIMTVDELIEVANGLSTNQSSYKDKTIVLMNNLDMTGKGWPYIKLDNAVGSLKFIGYGDGVTISNLNLSSTTSDNDTSCVGFIAYTGSMKSLSLEKITLKGLDTGKVDDSNTNAVGAFIGYAGTSENITISHCNVIGSNISGGHWTGGFVGYAAGYSIQNNGPVFEVLTIDNCTISNSTVTSPGSAGGIIGHATGDAWTRDEIKGCTVNGCTITSTGNNDNKAGSLMGTVGAGMSIYGKDGGVFVESCNVIGCTVESNSTTIDRIYGRQGTTGGVLCVDGEYVFFDDVDLSKAIDSGKGKILLPSRTYNLPTTNLGGKTITIIGQSTDTTVVNVPSQLIGVKNVAFENVTLKIDNANYQGFNSSESATFKNCVIEGLFFLYGPSVTFNGCTFKQTDSGFYNIWTHDAQNVTFSECTFECAGRSVLVYNEGGESGDMNVEFKECTMTATSPVEDKAAVQVDASLFYHSCTVVIDKSTADKITGFGTGSKSGSSIWNNKIGPSVDGVNVKISVGGEVVYTETAISKLDSLDEVTKNGSLTLVPKQTFTIDSGIANEEGNSRKVTFVGDGTQTVDVITKADSAEGGMLNYQRGSSFTFKNLTIQAGEGSFDGIVCDELTFTDCTIKGKLTLYGEATFTNCTFDNTMKNQYSIWTWGGTDVMFENCTFNTNGKAILLYGSATALNPTKLVVNGCTFNDCNDGAAAKAAIEIGSDYNATYTLTVDGATVNGFAKGMNTGSILWANKNSMDAEHLSVIIDGKTIQ